MAGPRRLGARRGERSHVNEAHVGVDQVAHGEHRADDPARGRRVEVGLRVDDCDEGGDGKADDQLHEVVCMLAE